MMRRLTSTFAIPAVCSPTEDEVTRVVREGGVLRMRIDGELIVHRVGAPRRRGGRSHATVSMGSAT